MKKGHGRKHGEELLTAARGPEGKEPRVRPFLNAVPVVLDKHGNPVQKDLSRHGQWPHVLAGEAPDCTKFPKERTIIQASDIY